MVNRSRQDAYQKRAVQLRMRHDLEIVPVDRDTLDLTYVVKDPVSLRYARLRPDEHFVLQRLDGKTSLETIRSRYRAEYPHQTVRLNDLESLLHRFHQLGLVLADTEGQGDRLVDRGVDETRHAWLAQIANFLFIRFPGVDPEPFLNRCYPLVSWLFSPLTVLLSVAAMLWALLLVLMNFEILVSELPSLDSLFSSRSLLVIMLIVSATKIVHELGHAFTCHHFGCECHEIGPMLMVMTPAMYCDTSDSWLLPNRWQRIAVAAAGMYVELLLAAIATFVWWWTEPGTVHNLSLRFMMICSISTVLFNANPLLRYDGYYILSDLSRVPNLAQEASGETLAMLRRYGLGMEETRKQLVASRWFLSAYAVSSSLYRWGLVLSIVFVVSKAMEHHQMRGLGSFLTVCAVGGMLVMPTKQTYQFLESPGRRNQIKRGRLLISLMIVLILGSLILFVPLPHRVYGDAELKSTDQASVYASNSGVLVDQLVRPGQPVKKGDVLLRLRNEDLEQRAKSTELLVNQHRLSVENLEKLQIRYPQLASQIPAAKSAWKDARQQYARALERLDTLEIKAHETGIFISTSRRLAQRGGRELPRWDGLPTAHENRGAWIESGTEIGSIRNPDTPIAELILEQADIPYVEEGQVVTCWIRGYETLFHGEVMEISKRDVEAVSERLSVQSGGGVAVNSRGQNQSSKPPPMFASYYARVQLSSDMSILPGTRGFGRIDVGRESLAQKLMRQIATMLRLR